MRIYICTPQKTRRFYNKSLMGLRGLSITLCMCVYMCVYVHPDNGFPALNQSPVIICSVRNTYGNLSRKGNMNNFTKDQISALCFQKPLSQMVTDACGQSDISTHTQTYTDTQPDTHMQLLSAEGITIFSRLSQIRQDQIISLLGCQFSAV